MERAVALRTQMRWGGPLLVVFLLVLAMAAQSARSSTADARPVVQAEPLARVIYLPDAGKPVISPAVAGTAHLRIATSPGELVASVGDAAAILLDPGAFAATDKAWLGARLAEGRLIVVLNVPFVALEQLPGYNPVTPSGPFQDYTGSPYFSWAWQWEGNGKARYDLKGSDRFSTAAAFLSRLESQVRDLETFRAQIAAPQPTPQPGGPTTRPRP